GCTVRADSRALPARYRQRAERPRRWVRVGQTPTLPDELLVDAAGGASAIASAADLARLLTTPPDPPDPPDDAFAHPGAAARQTFQGTYWALADLGVPVTLAYLGAFLAALIGLLGGDLGAVL